MTLTGSQPEVAEFFRIHVELVEIFLNTLWIIWNNLEWNGIELHNCKLLESIGRIQRNNAVEDKWYVNWDYLMMFIPVVISQSTKLVGTIFYWVWGDLVNAPGPVDI